MWRRLMVATLTVVLATTVAATAVAPIPRPADLLTPGDPGIGDDYFPLDGNGGYDVDHYDLAITYDPASGVLQGVATIRARPRRTCPASTLTWQGLTVRSVEVDAGPRRSPGLAPN